MKYDPLLPSCNLCMTTMEEAARRLGPSFIYDLYVNPTQILGTRDMLRGLVCMVKDNPFAPYVNLFVDDRLKPYEWYLCANNKAVGSDGP